MSTMREERFESELYDRMPEYFRPGYSSWRLSTRDLSRVVGEIVDRETSANLGEIQSLVDDFRTSGDWTAADLLDGIARKLDRGTR